MVSKTMVMIPLNPLANASRPMERIEKHVLSRDVDITMCHRTQLRATGDVIPHQHSIEHLDGIGQGGIEVN
jgi:hypothetical protein